MNGFHNSTNTTSEEESMSDNESMFLYARAVHSYHSIQYHMHQIMERQKVIDEYRNMTMEGLDLIPLESNLHRYHPVVISQIVGSHQVPFPMCTLETLQKYCSTSSLLLTFC